MVPSINQWKELSEEERKVFIGDSKKFNAYTDEAYELLRSVGEDLRKVSIVKIIKIGVLNKHGTLILPPHVAESDLSTARNKGIKEHLGFEVIFSSINSWFEH